MSKLSIKLYLACLFMFFVVVLMGSITNIYASNNEIEYDGYSIFDIKELISDEFNLEVYSEDGKVEKIAGQINNEYQNKELSSNNSKMSATFDEIKITDSGRPDSESIVVTIMGDGFTSSEQTSFISAASNLVNYLIGNDETGDEGFYPYNLFRDYFTVYAIKVISEESGVSRDSDYNDGNTINNYFGSSFYYGNNSSSIQRALVITKYNKARALEKNGSSMTAIICNSTRWGGTGGEFAVLSMHPNFGRIITHEFGHSFGKLADEYWYTGESFSTNEAANKTNDGNIDTNKWSRWIGKYGVYSGIGIYRFSSNPTDIAYNWFKPHQNCQMQYSESPFCAVCAEQLIEKMEDISGDFFEVSYVSNYQIQIDNVNYLIRGKYELPPLIDGKDVVAVGCAAFANQLCLTSITIYDNIITIGDNSFKNCTNLESIVLPDTITTIGDSAFENCTSLQSITLPNTLESIGTLAFKGCSSLEETEIPETVLYIGDYAFYNCSSLENLILNRDRLNITRLGNYVFNGCSSSLQIIVPKNRLAEYKCEANSFTYRNKIRTDDDSFDEINLNCSVYDFKNITLDNGYNKLYKLEVDCAKSYRFTTNSPTNIIIYNSNMYNVYNGESLLAAYLSKGTYYLSIESLSDCLVDNFELSYYINWPLEITFNSNANLLSYLHLDENNNYHVVASFNNINGEKLYKFSLNAGTNSTYLSDAIKIYRDSSLTNLLDRYSVDEFNYLACSYVNENEMYVFLPENRTYYIEITLPRNDYTSLQFIISNVEEESIDYSNSLATSTTTNLFNNKTSSSYFEKVDISHRSKIKIELNSNTGCFSRAKLYVFKINSDRSYDTIINHYSLTSILQVDLIRDEDVYNSDIILDEGSYYMGYTNNTSCSLNLSLRRLINNNVNMDGTLVADPVENQGYTIGSEVLLNDGFYNDYYITEGFTRCIYLMVDNNILEPNSRLDYDWYSSNESVATVSMWGTVLAKNVDYNTTVTIYAILKTNPSVVYKKTFIIVNETSNEEIIIYTNMSYSCSEENGIYKLELDSLNSPYPYIQYYDLNILNQNQSSGIIVTIDECGYVTSNGTCNITIVCWYSINRRVTVVINLTIAE